MSNATENFIRGYENALPVEQCNRLIDYFESLRAYIIMLFAFENMYIHSIAPWCRVASSAVQQCASSSSSQASSNQEKTITITVTIIKLQNGKAVAARY